MGVTIYGPEVREPILSRLASGESLRAICRSDGMPTETLVRQWVMDDEAFASQYARARSMGIDALAERGMEVAADKTRDPNDRRVELDAIKWFASKMKPDKYGDRQILAGDKDAPLGIEFVVSTVKRD